MCYYICLSLLIKIAGSAIAPVHSFSSSLLVANLLIRRARSLCMCRLYLTELKLGMLGNVYHLQMDTRTGRMSINCFNCDTCQAKMGLRYTAYPCLNG